MVIVLDCWSAKMSPKSKANYKIKTFYEAKQEYDNEADLTATCEIHVSVKGASHVVTCSSTKQIAHATTCGARVNLGTGELTELCKIQYVNVWCMMQVKFRGFSVLFYVLVYVPNIDSVFS